MMSAAKTCMVMAVLGSFVLAKYDGIVLMSNINIDITQQVL